MHTSRSSKFAHIRSDDLEFREFERGKTAVEAPRPVWLVHVLCAYKFNNSRQWRLLTVSRPTIFSELSSGNTVLDSYGPRMHFDVFEKQYITLFFFLAFYTIWENECKSAVIKKMQWSWITNLTLILLQSRIEIEVLIQDWKRPKNA